MHAFFFFSGVGAWLGRGCKWLGLGLTGGKRLQGSCVYINQDMIDDWFAHLRT